VITFSSVITEIVLLKINAKAINFCFMLQRVTFCVLMAREDTAY